MTSPDSTAALVRFLADCLLTGSQPLMTDDTEALDFAEAAVELAKEKGLIP